MTAIVYCAIYAGLLVFLFGCIQRIVQYGRNPIHLRWELYPVPHEDPSRVAHGGSYFESGNWWTEPRHSNRGGELRVMIPEILFLKGLWEFNRSLWLPSFLFHFGLYLSIITTVLVTISAAVPLAAANLASSAAWLALAHVYRATGYVGAAFILLGSVLLLIRRTTDGQLRNYTKAADIFNLVFFIITFAFLAIGYGIASPDMRALARGLTTIDLSLRIGTTFGIGLILASVLIAYIPFTHMSHFIAKYFAYHAVRWDDRTNVRGGSIESKVAECLAYRPTWSAAHIGADGTKNWVEIATTNPAQEIRK
jgi:nitrate reductase gamma subunit